MIMIFLIMIEQAGGRRAVREAESFCNGVVFTRCISLYLCICVFVYLPGAHHCICVYFGENLDFWATFVQGVYTGNSVLQISAKI